jgi:hypothetical protein
MRRLGKNLSVSLNLIGSWDELRYIQLAKDFLKSEKSIENDPFELTILLLICLCI